VFVFQNRIHGPMSEGSYMEHDDALKKMSESVRQWEEGVVWKRLRSAVFENFIRAGSL